MYSDPVKALNGVNQGGDGLSQAHMGSFYGQATGGPTGINRAATGGPNMENPAPQPAVTPTATGQNATRKPEGLFSFLGSVANIAAPFIPGIGGVIAKGVGALAGGVAGAQAQGQANAASQAATGAQTGIAAQLAQGPQLQPLIQQEQAGISSAVRNSNVANPGRLIADLFGSAITNAISGVTSQRNSALESASSIYGGVGANAMAAAQAEGNPWQGLIDFATGVAKPKTGGGATGNVATGAGSSTSVRPSGSTLTPPGPTLAAPSSAPSVGLPGYKPVQPVPWSTAPYNTPTAAQTFQTQGGTSSVPGLKFP